MIYRQFIRIGAKIISVLCTVTLIITALGGVGPQAAIAQETTPEPDQPDPSAEELTKVGATIIYDDKTGLAQFISFEQTPLSISQVAPTFGGASPEAVARAFLDSYGSLFGLGAQAQELIIQNESSGIDDSYVHFQQVYQGIPVFGGELIVSLDGQKNIKSANGEITPDLSVSTLPTIDSASAAAIAIEAIAKWQGVETASLIASTPELWIYDPSLVGPMGGPVALVWRTEITSTNLVPIRELVLVNAHQGGIALHFNQVDTLVGPHQLQEETPTDLPTETPTETTETATITPVTPTETASTATAEPTEAATVEPISTEKPPSESVQTPEQSLEAQAATWYVAPSPTGNDSDSCSDPSAPCATINGAIGKAASNDIVKVAEGTYTDSSAGSTVVLFNKNISVSGGWDNSFTTQTSKSTVNGQATRTGLTVNPGITASVEYMIFQNGIGSSGGGVYNRGNLSLDYVDIIDNFLTGLWNVGGGIVTINNSTIARNEYYGIYSGSGTVNVSNSTIYANRGNGIYSSNNSGVVNLTNVTISGNEVGIAAASNTGVITISNSTIAGNSVYLGNPDNAGGIRNDGIASHIILRNSILARNSVNTVRKDCDGAITSQGYNLIGSDIDCSITAATGDQIGTQDNPIDPLLGPLQDNGGPVQTLGLLIGSPAIDAGNPSIPGSGGDACATTDARSSTRPVNAACDIGAFEGSVTGVSFPLVIVFTNNPGGELPGTYRCSGAFTSCDMWNDADIDGAFLVSGNTYNYYAMTFGRDSIDDEGMPLQSTVHYCPGDTCASFPNAFWNGSQAAFGSGYAQADDIVAHELTHGVTQYESNLFYYYQSGAINEAFSDIFGEFIDQANGTGTDTSAVKWLFGEDLPGGAIRDMEDPGAFSQPDKISSGNYNEGGCDPSASLPTCDNGYVHTNSGVANKAAYLMAQGGTFNGRTVTQLGNTKTAAIWYEAQTHLLTSGADYADLSSALYRACVNLIGGSFGVTVADCVEVQDATLAVEMTQQPGANYNPEAAMCPAGKVPNNIFFDNLENGSAKWTFTNDATPRWQLDMPAEYGSFAHSGQHHLFGNDTPPSVSDTNVAMTTGVVIPSNAFLHFAHAFGFENSGTTYFDGGVLEYSSNGGAWTDAGSLIDTNGYRGTLASDTGNPLTSRQGYVGDSHGYISTRLNLSSKAGQTLRFRWRMGLDINVVDWGWWVDDVRIYTCVVAKHAPADFDGDGRSDLALYYNDGHWAWLTSGSNFTSLVTNSGFTTNGGATSLLGNDFDGDLKVDATIYHSDWGQIDWRRSSDNVVGQFGYFTTASPHPVAISANDYDGDGKSDPALYYPNNGVWSWKNSSNNSSGVAAFNPAGNPTPIPNADLNGDGKSDPSLYYSDTGVFAWNANGTVGTAAFNPVGNPLPFLADFDGDGKSDPALYYQTYALWAWKRSSDGVMTTAAFNPAGGPQPVVGYFDSDNKADAGLYYSTFGLWAWKRSIDGGIGTAAYNPGGSPEPQLGSDFDGDGKNDPALYYRDWGLWAWKQSSDEASGLAPYNPNGNPVVIGELDFDGDGRTDPGLYYQTWGLWAWKRSSDGTVITKTVTSTGSPQPVR